MTKSICGPLNRALVSSAIILMIVLPVAAQDCPQLLGRWPYGTARAVAVSGSLAFVGSGTALLVLGLTLGLLSLAGTARMGRRKRR